MQPDLRLQYTWVVYYAMFIHLAANIHIHYIKQTINRLQLNNLTTYLIISSIGGVDERVSSPQVYSTNDMIPYLQFSNFIELYCHIVSPILRVTIARKVVRNSHLSSQNLIRSIPHKHIKDTNYNSIKMCKINAVDSEIILKAHIINVAE